MKPHLPLLAGAGVIGAALLLFAAAPPPAGSHHLTNISPRKFADSLHAVIAADRAVYGRLIVDRLAGADGPTKVSREWRADQCLPTHAQLLREAATDIQRRGAEFSYALRGVSPINPGHGPQTAIEEAGLEFLRQHPGTNFYSAESLGGRGYFTAIYPDRATTAACVECHNRHPESPRRDFREGDLMGAIVVRVPLEF